MSSEPDQSLLAGGRTTPGVTRIGDTVRRPPSLNSDFVQRLLRYLDAVGLDCTPRALGRDEDGRDVFGWIEGDVPAQLSPGHADIVLRAAARLVRRYHDATAALLDAPAARSAGLEVVCHNDLSPCNFVFRSGMPVALIDFDTAAPGTRASDIGYAAWLWLDLGNADITPPEQRRRLGIVLDGYGSWPGRADVVEAILHRQGLLVAQGERLGNAGMARWAAGCRAWSRDHL